MATAGQLSPYNINYRPPASPTSTSLVPGITASNANYQNQQINNLSKYYQGYYNQDETYQGQLRNLQAQLQGGWTGPGGVIPQAQQLALAYGGALPGGVANFNIPTFNGQKVGMSLLQGLSDPTQMANAQNNPFSALNTIAQQLHGQNITGFHGLGGRGLGHSGAINALGGANEFQAQKQRYGAANDFMTQLNSLYGGFMGNLDKAAETQSGYLNDAFGRATDLIKNGILGTPTKVKAAPTTNPTRTTAGAGIAGGTATRNNPRGYNMSGIPGTWGGISPHTSLPQYTPQNQTYVGPTGRRSPLGAEQGMYHMGGGFKVTPRGRQLY